MLLASIPSDSDSATTYATLREKTSAFGECSKFAIPSLKIGTLDSLVVLSEELVKLDQQFTSTVERASDVLKSIFEGDESRTRQYRLVNEKPVEAYLQLFAWNTIKYRIDRPMADLVDLLNQEMTSLESDIKNKHQQYTGAKSSLAQVQRKATGNLSQKSLAGIVKKEHIVPQSDYLSTIFIAVPTSGLKDWRNIYESLTPMVVPRSSQTIASDSDFTLFSVVVFKKHAQEYSHKAREHKFIPRDFVWTEDSSAESQREMGEAQNAEKTLYSETLRLVRTGFSDAVQVLMHLKAMRVFVESVLRYGLPPEFVSVLLRPLPKQNKKLKRTLDLAYNYLGGLEYQKKLDLGEYSSMVEGGNEGYVVYEFSI